MVLGLLGLYVILESPERVFVYLMFVFRWNVWLCVKKAEFLVCFLSFSRKWCRIRSKSRKSMGSGSKHANLPKRSRSGQMTCPNPVRDLSRKTSPYWLDPLALLCCPSLFFLRDGYLSDSVLNQIKVAKQILKLFIEYVFWDIRYALRHGILNGR